MARFETLLRSLFVVALMLTPSSSFAQDAKDQAPKAQPKEDELKIGEAQPKGESPGTGTAGKPVKGHIVVIPGAFLFNEALQNDSSLNRFVTSGGKLMVVVSPIGSPMRAWSDGEGFVYVYVPQGTVDPQIGFQTLRQDGVWVPTTAYFNGGSPKGNNVHHLPDVGQPGFTWFITYSHTRALYERTQTSQYKALIKKNAPKWRKMVVALNKDQELGVDLSYLEQNPADPIGAQAPAQAKDQAKAKDAAPQGADAKAKDDK